MATTLKVTTSLLGETRVGTITGNPGLGSDATLEEAIKNGYVIGKKEVIRGQVEGVMKAMFEGVSRDGNGRKIDEIISLQPYAVGSLGDICDTIDKEHISAVLRARMLKQMNLNAKSFTFIFEGSTGIQRITVITTGEEEGVVVIGEAVRFNGLGIEMKNGDTITYLIPETGVTGVISRDLITSENTRITAAEGALSELAADPANDGRDIVFTVKLGNKKVVKSAKIRVM